MVGIGGGVPLKVRLGDIVVGVPVYDSPGIVQWDSGITQNNSFKRIGGLNKTPEVLRTTIPKLKAQHEIDGSNKCIFFILEEVQSKHQTLTSKYLQSDYDHISERVRNTDDGEEEDDNDDDDGYEERKEDGTANCQYCNRTRVVKKKASEIKDQNSLQSHSFW